MVNVPVLSNRQWDTLPAKGTLYGSVQNMPVWDIKIDRCSSLSECDCAKWRIGRRSDLPVNLSD